MGTINVIFTTPRKEPHLASGIMLVSSQVEGPKEEAPSKRPKISDQPIIGFSEDDKFRTIQRHDDALVVTLRIAGYDVKRVMIYQGNGVEIMYPDLFKGLGLKPEDLDQYNSPMIRFNGNVIIPKGRIRLLVLTRDRMVNVDFIIGGAFSLYTAILARPWLHAMGAVTSTLQVKVKYLTNGGVAKLVGSQSTTRQCMVAAIDHHVTELSFFKMVLTL